MKRLGIGMAAAFVSIGGIALAYAHHRSTMPSTRLTFGADPNQTVSMSYTLPKVIRQITISAGAGAPLLQIPTNETATASKLLAWLQAAHSTTVRIPASDTRFVPTGGDPRLPRINFKNGARNLSIQRVLYFTSTPQGEMVHYIPDVVELDEGSTVTYLRSKVLYDWLTDGTWRAEFLVHSQTQVDGHTYQVFAPSFVEGQALSMTPKGIAWFSRPNAAIHRAPGTDIFPYSSPVALYLSPSTARALDVRTATKLMTLPLFIHGANGETQYVIGSGLQSDGQWLFYTLSYETAAGAFVKNDLRVVNLYTHQQQAVTSFQVGKGLSFWYFGYQNNIFYDQRTPSGDALFMHNLATHRTVKLPSYDFTNGIVHGKVNGKTIHVALQKWD